MARFCKHSQAERVGIASEHTACVEPEEPLCCAHVVRVVAYQPPCQAVNGLSETLIVSHSTGARRNPNSRTGDGHSGISTVKAFEIPSIVLG